MGPAIPAILGALTAFFFILSVLVMFSAEKLKTINRINKLSNSDKKQDIRTESIKRGNTKRGDIRILKKLDDMIASSGMMIRSSEFIMLSCLAAVLPAGVMYVFSKNVIMMLAVLIIGACLPPVMLHIKKAKRLELFEKQLVEAISIICNCLKSGLTFQQALHSIAKEMPDPISKEFNRVLRETNLGNNIEKALMNMSERLNSKNFMLMVSAIMIQRQTGGNLSEILSNIAGTIKERYKIKSEIKVLTATGRTSGLVIGLMPIIILLFFMLVNPSYVNGLFHTQAGINMMIAAAVLEVVGFFFIRKTVNIKY